MSNTIASAMKKLAGSRVRISKSALCIVLFWASGPVSGDMSELRHDGHLRLYAYHVDEFVSIRYLDENGRWIDEAYRKINHLLRCRTDHATTRMDKRLIELADHLQDHFQVDTIEVISAYRSPDYNRRLKENGHGVSDESLHTKGLAMDIHIDEIAEADLRDYLVQIEKGGVGYYGDLMMVHMDLGPVRQWHAGDFRENTDIGVFNEECPVKITTDKLFYAPEERMNLSFQGIETSPMLKINKFHRGKWMEIGEISGRSVAIFEIMEKALDFSPYGKFRFQYEKGDCWQNSNEFYIKKYRTGQMGNQTAISLKTCDRLCCALPCGTGRKSRLAISTPQTWSEAPSSSNGALCCSVQALAGRNAGKAPLHPRGIHA